MQQRLSCVSPNVSTWPGVSRAVHVGDKVAKRIDRTMARCAHQGRRVFDVPLSPGDDLRREKVRRSWLDDSDPLPLEYGIGMSWRQGRFRADSLVVQPVSSKPVGCSDDLRSGCEDLVKFGDAVNVGSHPISPVRHHRHPAEHQDADGLRWGDEQIPAGRRE